MTAAIQSQGTVLITKTLIYNASMILEDEKYFKLERFFDLCSLVEALCLFDRLVFIDSSNVLDYMRFGKQLLKEKFVEEFKPIFTREDYHNFLNTLPNFILEFSNKTFWERGEEAQLKNPETDRYKSPEWPYFYDDYRPMSKLIKVEKDRLEYEGGRGTVWWHEDNNVPESYVFDTQIDLSNFPNALDWLNDLVHYPSLPEEVRASEAYIRRSIGYYLVATKAKIPYYPDFVRIPHIMSYIERLYQPLRQQLYAVLSKCFRCEIREIEEDTKSFSFPIPPLVSLVLANSSSIGEIPEQVFRLRDGLKDFRSRIRKMETTLISATELGARQKIIRQKHQLFKELTSSYENNEVISFKGALDFAEAVADGIKSPTDPTSYVKSLASLPIEQLKKWWVRRPIMPLCRIDKKLKKIEDYEKLIQKIWHINIDDNVKDLFKMHGNVVEKIFDNW